MVRYGEKLDLVVDLPLDPGLDPSLVRAEMLQIDVSVCLRWHGSGEHRGGDNSRGSDYDAN